MVELTASGDADQVEARLREALDTHGLQLFARIDHAAGARQAEVDLEPDVLLIFGNVRVGTPLMQADPRVGIELPLRMLIWQDPDGTHVGYLDPRELARPLCPRRPPRDARAADRGAHGAGRRGGRLSRCAQASIRASATPLPRAGCEGWLLLLCAKCRSCPARAPFGSYSRVRSHVPAAHAVGR